MICILYMCVKHVCTTIRHISMYLTFLKYEHVYGDKSKTFEKGVCLMLNKPYKYQLAQL